MRSLFKNPFTVKAIETEYDGCRFASRLEARWAVFFNTLSIPYEYEKEGYELADGTRYLADFWLPEQDSWVEIKGQEPTEEERRKARLLALHSLKDVYIFYGNIEVPNLQKLHAFLCYPPELYTHPVAKHLLGMEVTNGIKAPSNILTLLQQVTRNRLELSIYEDGDLVLRPEDSYYYTIDSLDDLLNDLQQQYQTVSLIKSFLEEKENEVRSLLTPGPGWKVTFLDQDEDGEEQAYWGECDKCGAIRIANGLINHHRCKDGTQGKLLHNTPRLIASYKAARSARFEWWRR